mgnify:CR=1 FL=1
MIIRVNSAVNVEENPLRCLPVVRVACSNMILIGLNVS